MGVNCIPCFDHRDGKAKEVGLTDDDIREAVATAYQVKNGAANFLKSAIDDVVEPVDNTEQPCCTPATAECSC